MTWRPVVGYEDHYEVSDDGYVRRIKAAPGATVGRILFFAKDRKGYRRVTLSVGGKGKRPAVHRLVAHAFIGPPPPGAECNHIDGNKKNNVVANLEWVTPLENHRHARRLGLIRPLEGEANGRAKLTLAQVGEIRALAGTETQQTTASRYGISAVRVGQLQRGLGWQRASNEEAA
jgi:hypothetical protein